MKIVLITYIGFKLIKENLFFDNEYTTYGLEDTQFGLDAIRKGFSLQTCLAPIIHQESTNIDLFILKITSLLKKINPSLISCLV